MSRDLFNQVNFSMIDKEIRDKRRIRAKLIQKLNWKKKQELEAKQRQLRRLRANENI